MERTAGSWRARLRLAALCVASCAVALAAADPAAARCLAQKPAVVTLVGELVSKRVAGPPGYRSLAQGDLPETIVMLRLGAPICVKGDPTSSLNARSHAGIAEVQLVVPFERARALVDQQIAATGSLTAARSRHHRTPVVLEVSGLRAR